MQYLIGVILIVVGGFATSHSFFMTRLVGKAAWAERYLGVGGTYTFWKLFGILLIMIGLLMMRFPGWFGFVA